jgi:hypothetical protein
MPPRHILVQKVPYSRPNGLGQLRPPFFVAQQHPDRVNNAITYLPCQCYHLPTYAFSRAEHQSIYLPKQQVPPLSVPLYRVISPLRALINKLTINWRYLPLQQSKAICATLLLPTSPPGDRWIPHPRLLLRRLGGWGIPDSRCVYSVGLEGRPAGGVVEAVARPEWPFAAEPVPSGGGALLGAATRRPPSPRPQVPGSRRRGVSSPDLAWRRIWISSLEKKLAGWCIAAVSAAQGVRSSVVRRLPSCRGAVSHPWRRVEQVQWRATGPLWSSAKLGSREGPPCNFFVSLDLSVMNGASI